VICDYMKTWLNIAPPNTVTSKIGKNGQITWLLGPNLTWQQDTGRIHITHEVSLSQKKLHACFGKHGPRESIGQFFISLFSFIAICACCIMYMVLYHGWQQINMHEV